MKPGTGYLKAVNIHKSHDGDPVLKGINFSLDRGEIFCLLGPSGCGKTTLLRIIAGLESADQGQVVFNGRDLLNVPPYKRQFSMMFQEFALFPHKNVYENICFGLQMQKLPEDQIRLQAHEMVKLTGLQGLENRSITELSGGERQRVALARSLAPKPKLLMLDEPMGSLDRALRERLVADLRLILKKIDITVMFVTHDQNEAFVLADRVAVFNKGFIAQIDTPKNLFRHPQSVFVAGFLGFHNLFPEKEVKKGVFETVLGSIELPRKSAGHASEPFLLIRPEAARIVTPDAPCTEMEMELSCRIEDCRFKGPVYQVEVSVSGTSNLVFNLSSETDPVPKPGNSLTMALKKSAISLIREG